MILSLAPMEAITGYIFRNAYNKYFGDADRFYTPFVTGMKLGSKEKNDLMPEHNRGMTVIPQILTNRAEEFISMTKQLQDTYGYEEVNFNLGCPSGTVVAKNRGAGFLNVLDELDAFLDEIFTKCNTKISIKTRIGVSNFDEWGDILEIYNKYPLSELIIHPRCQKDMYSFTPNLEAFSLAVSESRHKLVYNGDVCTVEDYNRIISEFPTVDGIMCGRGILKNPGLFGEIKGKSQLNGDMLKSFIHEIYLGYKEIMSGDRNVLFKMKELWFYLADNFEDSARLLKRIRKANSCMEYEAAISTAGYLLTSTS